MEQPKLYDITTDDYEEAEEILYELIDRIVELEKDVELKPEIKITYEEDPFISSKIKRETGEVEQYRTVENETYDDRKKSRYNKLYFTTESDSNQTRFEILSNHLKIAVSAKSDLVGNALGVLLRQIIDSHRPFFFLESIDLEREKFGGRKTFTLDEILQMLADYSGANDQIHNILTDGIYVTAELIGWRWDDQRNMIDFKTTINRFVGDVDIWDIHRIGNAVGYLSANERYINIPV